MVNARSQPADAVAIDQPAAICVPRLWYGALGPLAVVVAGICLGQFVLCGSSLVGNTILLPLDVLTHPQYYSPITKAPARIPRCHNWARADLVCLVETSRQFAASEVRAGRWPTWAPFSYTGAPFVEYPKYSPFSLLSYCFPSPVVLAWQQMALALIAGVGGNVFCRRSLGIGRCPATIVAWCWPLSGTFIFWQGYHIATAVGWLPWLLAAVDRAVRRARPASVALLAAATCVTMISAHLDMAGEVLLGSGLYAVWCLIDQYGRQLFRREGRWAIAALACGWGCGMLLAAPQILPMLEYGVTGARMILRSRGAEERPPVGLAALPQAVLPDIYGNDKDCIGMYPPGEGNQMESAAATYAGLLTTFVAAPLAFCDHRRRKTNIFWLSFALLGIGWCLNISPLVAVLRIPPLNMFSFNRFVFITSCALFVMAGYGLDALLAEEFRPRWWFPIPALLLLVLLGWCVERAVHMPEPLATQLEQAVRHGNYARHWISAPGDVHQAQTYYAASCAVAAVFCALGIGCWVTLMLMPHVRRRLVPVLAVLALADLLWFADGRWGQFPPELYYPRIAALEQVARAQPGRVLGCACLPANLSVVAGLCDVRGYDSVDPAAIVDLLVPGWQHAYEPQDPTGLREFRPRVAHPGAAFIKYAMIQNFVPRMEVAAGGKLRIAPILDMLNARYLVFRGLPPQGVVADFQSPDYWVQRNDHALPRAYVPPHVAVEADATLRLKKMFADDFDPHRTAYVEENVDLPANCEGTAEIVEDLPSRVKLALRMKTAGLVVLADLWDKGWKATLDGRPVNILHANHALRGVVVPAGAATLEFRYEPRSIVWGWRLFALGFVGCMGCIACGRRFAPPRLPFPTASPAP